MYPVPLLGPRHGRREPHRVEADGGGIWEFPPFVKPTFFGNVPAGGSLPLRILPIKTITAWIREANAAGRLALLYLHPWEIDPEHPRIPMPWPKGLFHYFRLAETEARFRAILSALPFGSLEEACAEAEGGFL